MIFLQERSVRMLFPCASYVSPLFLLTKLYEGPLFPAPERRFIEFG